MSKMQLEKLFFILGCFFIILPYVIKIFANLSLIKVLNSDVFFSLIVSKDAVKDAVFIADNLNKFTKQTTINLICNILTIIGLISLMCFVSTKFNVFTSAEVVDFHQKDNINNSNLH